MHSYAYGMYRGAHMYPYLYYAWIHFSRVATLFAFTALMLMFLFAANAAHASTSYGYPPGSQYPDRYHSQRQYTYHSCGYGYYGCYQYPYYQQYYSPYTLSYYPQYYYYPYSYTYSYPYTYATSYYYAW